MKHRSRIIKGEFFQNRKLAGLSANHRLLFIGLWLIADREGRLQDDPDLVKAMIFPFENIPVDKLLTDLAEFGFIERYNGSSEACIFIPKFLEHQKIHTHEAQSKLPEPQNVVKCSVMSPVDSEIKVGRGNSNSNSRSRSKDQEIPYEEIISHLNLLTHKNWRHTGGNTRRYIRVRWNEGFRLDDFLYVNQVKAETWLNTEQEKYLRPETLYGNKMEGYRQERRIPRQYSEKTNKALVAAALFLKRRGFTLETERLTEIDSGDAEVTVSIPKRD